MDTTTLIGLIGGLISVLGAVVIEGHGNPAELVPFFTNISAFVIIFGGTACATLLSITPEEVKLIGSSFSKLLKKEEYDFAGMIATIVSFAEKARREGLLALSSDIEQTTNPLLKKGLQLVVDGVDPELVREVLETNLLQEKHNLDTEATLWETAGGFAPTMGMIGAIMGLVGALGRLEEAGMEGTVANIAVAFIASFWGILIANVIFLPLCNKVRSRSKNQHVMGQVIMEGVLCILAGNNPRIVKDRLDAFISLEGSEAKAAAPEGAAK